MDLGTLEGTRERCGRVWRGSEAEHTRRCCSFYACVVLVLQRCWLDASHIHISVNATVYKPSPTTTCHNRQRMEREREQQLEEGENCQLVLQLPDGSQHSHSFKLGATVAYVKLQVQELYGVPMEKQLLQTAGRTLIDPRECLECLDGTKTGCASQLSSWK